MINNTAKVVNIAFQTKLVKKAQTRCSQVEDRQQSDMSMQGFMKSRVSTKLMYQLLNIFKAQPKSLKEIIKASNINNVKAYPQATQSQQQQFTQQKQGDNNLQLQTIMITRTNQQQQTFQNAQSIDDQVISKTNTIYLHKDGTDSISQYQNRFVRQGKKHLSAFSPSQKCKLYQNNLKESQNNKFYLIPSQYQPNLIFLLTHFLKFKIFNNKKSNQNTLGKSTITKRPKTTSKKALFNKPQNFTSPQNKPTTANSNSRTINYKKIPTLPSDLAEDFNQHLQKNHPHVKIALNKIQKNHLPLKPTLNLYTSNQRQKQLNPLTSTSINHIKEKVHLLNRQNNENKSNDRYQLNLPQQFKLTKQLWQKYILNKWEKVCQV